MKRYFGQLSFKGTDFHGWQNQPNANTVQATIELAISQLFSKKHYPIVGCGRTDTGVHAKKFYFHVELPEQFEEATLLKKLNLVLPKTIVLKQFYAVDHSLHARFSASSRTYCYFIHTSKDPFINDVSWFFPKELNISKMNSAAMYLLGQHDFTSFAKVHSDVKTSICDVTFAEWRMEGAQLIFEIRANRFLRNMVRAIVGTLIEVGTGKLIAEDIQKIMAKKDRQSASLSVPPQGLFLWEIVY